MKDLIKVTEKEGKQIVSARNLYIFLGLDKSQWARWSKKNIEGNSFMIENEDWQGFDIMSSGNKTKDYAITLEFAKRISMMAKTKKGNEARSYFLECEKKAKELQVPKTFAQALRLAAEQQEAIEAKDSQIQSLEESLDESEQWISIVRASKECKVKETTFNWRDLKRYSIDNGIEIKAAPCPRFMTKKLYHLSVFNNLYPDICNF